MSLRLARRLHRCMCQCRLQARAALLALCSTTNLDWCALKHGGFGIALMNSGLGTFVPYAHEETDSDDHKADPR